MSKLKTTLVATGLLASLLTAQSAQAGAIRNVSFDTNVLARNDDGSTGQVSLGFDANFYGSTFDSVYVNNNGNVTFDASLPTFTPLNLNSTKRQIIAPFFADVDTRNLLSSVVTYGSGTIEGRDAFVVSWDDVGVGYFNQRADKLNQFQLVLIDRSDTGVGNFDIEFNYDKIVWETGDVSGGIDGLGGISARVGFSDGTGTPGTFFELPGSAVSGAFLDGGPKDLTGSSLNSDVDGRYVFAAREGNVGVVPEPLTMLGAGAAASFGAYFKKKLASRKNNE